MYKINPRISEPIYKQIILSIKENVYLGNIEPGDKIPSVREMARILTTNPNTVAKAYRELERENVIEVLKGRGTYVAEDVFLQLKLNKEEINKVKAVIIGIVKKSQYQGITKDQIKKWIDQV